MGIYNKIIMLGVMFLAVFLGLASQEVSATIKVKAYFNNDRLDPEHTCVKVFPVTREVVQSKAVARAALQELLKGPAATERAEGYYTHLNTGVKIQKLTIKDGVAKVDFNEALQYRVAGSCRTSAIIAQITRTLKQFPTVKRVIISINGRSEDILQP